MATPIKLQRLTQACAATYRGLMLEAYALQPQAFTSSVAERSALPLSWWQARLQITETAGEAVFGAWDGEVLAGVVGLAFESREKTRHKATLFGLYVRAPYRQRGLGRQLLCSAWNFLGSRPEVKVVQLTVTTGNSAAQSLYQQFGFVAFGTEPMAVAVAGAYVSKVHMWCSVESSSPIRHGGG